MNRCELMSSILEALTLSNGSPQSMEKLAAIAFSSRMKAGEKADILSVISLCVRERERDRVCVNEFTFMNPFMCVCVCMCKFS